MKLKTALTGAAVLAAAGIAVTMAVEAQTASRASFFLTSAGTGKGADLGGLDGADAHCAALAKAAGLTRQNWRAYLSVTPVNKDGKEVTPGVNARDRIGKGPWSNTKGVVVARNVAELHSDRSRINQDTALTEKGERVSGRAESLAKTGPNQHDILTGSDPQGLYIVAGDTTCGNWTKSSGDGPGNSAIVGHHDRIGLTDARNMKSWNSAHGSRGCSQDNLKASGGAGQFYCFSAK